MRSINISQIVPRFFPCIGGVENYVYNLVKKLQESGHEVSVLTSDLPPVGSYTLDKIKIQRLPVLFKFYDMPYCPSFPFYLRRVKADIIHVHTPSRFFSDSVSILHKLRLFSSCPLILTFHLYVESTRNLTKAVSDFHYKTISPLVFDSYDRIVVPTESYRTLLTNRFSLPPAKISVIPHGVNLEKFNPAEFDKNESRRKYGLSSEKVVLFIGRLDTEGVEQKGIKYLLEAVPLVLKSIHDVEFVVAGGGERLEYLRSMSRKMGIAPHVRFIGGFPFEETPSLISTADVYVLPSLFESFGITLCEAMAMQRPVISTRISGVTDVVEDGKTGLLVEPKNPKELAGAIQRILLDEHLAESLKQRGRKQVEARYDWDLSAKRILALYEECLD